MVSINNRSQSVTPSRRPLFPGNLLAAALDRCAPAKHYQVAYSGGLDSHALLHAAAQLRSQRNSFLLSAIHIHHGIQAEADRWAEHCAEICRALAVPLQIIHVDAAPASGESPEEAARNARYQALKRCVTQQTALLTAQHRDDQAETVLLQLFRGAGLAGLAGMGMESVFGQGRLIRPLLDCSRQSLIDYAHQHQLQWVEDSSNQQLVYDRNYLRHTIMPLLKKRWPGIDKTLQRSAGHCAEANDQLNRMADELLATLHRSERNTLPTGPLRHHDPATQRLILRAWIRQTGRRAPSTATIHRIIDELIPARHDKNPSIIWREGEIWRYRDELYCLEPQKTLDTTIRYRWDGQSTLKLEGNGELTSYPAADGIDELLWNSRCITVGYRRGGERCQLTGRSGRQQLKKLFQSAAIPPWRRSRIPLIYLDDQLAAVGEQWICEPFAARSGERSIRLRWIEN